MSVYLYSRVSISEQTVENQKIAARNAGYNVDGFYSDEGVSGSTDAEGRGQFSAMFDILKKDDTVLVAEISRIGRKVEDVMKTLRRFEERGVKVCVLAYGNLDLTSPVGKAMISMAATFAELELNDLKRRTKAGMARTKEQGTKLGQPLKITPEQLRAAALDKKSGMTLEQIAIKHSISKNTLRNNLIKWGNNLGGYEGEFRARSLQYANRAASLRSL